MTLNTLKSLRFLIPAVIIISFTALFGYFTGLWDIALPEKPKEWSNTVGGFLLSIFYYISGLRNWANAYWHKKVNENIRSKLIAISALDDDPDKYSWNAIKPIFYYFVDNDNSLTKKTELAYSNGLIWTTAADIRALSAIFTVFSIIMFWFGVAGTQVSAVAFLLIFALSFPLSHILTNFHKEIGDQQIDIIELYHQEELTAKLESIASKSYNTSD